MRDDDELRVRGSWFYQDRELRWWEQLLVRLGRKDGRHIAYFPADTPPAKDGESITIHWNEDGTFTVV